MSDAREDFRSAAEAARTVEEFMIEEERREAELMAEAAAIVPLLSSEALVEVLALFRIMACDCKCDEADLHAMACEIAAKHEIPRIAVAPSEAKS